MVDVSQKPVTVRAATAGCRIKMKASVAEVVRQGNASKGDVLAVARLAAIMAAKQTSTLIPLCHGIPIEKVTVDFRWESTPPESVYSDSAAGDQSLAYLHCEVEVCTSAKTGVEMEAMTAASVAGLTVYDMLKSVQRDIEIAHVRLIRKSGGKSGEFVSV